MVQNYKRPKCVEMTRDCDIKISNPLPKAVKQKMDLICSAEEVSFTMSHIQELLKS